MANGIAELAPPNEGGDDRDAFVLQQRLNEMLVTEYPTLSDGELEQLLTAASDADAQTQRKTESPRAHPDDIPEQRVPTHDMLAKKAEANPRVPEPIVFTEFLVGERGLSRRFRQRALGIHAGYLMLRRQHLRPGKPGVQNGEYRLG